MYKLNFNTENRLASVKVGTAQPTVFAYDADGQRVMTTQPDGTKVYTPFPDYEETVPVTGGATKRVTFSPAGQLIAVLVTTDTTNNYYYAYSDHLGNMTGWSDAAGVYLSNSIALHEPFGAYRFRPPASVNPGISDRGFTGHRMNNSATNDLGLIYMNARYYLPEIGRFISADTIVPEPPDPQSYNRYSYTRNNPTNLIDPTGHRECVAPDGSCGPYVSPWAVASQEYEVGQDLTFGPEEAIETHLFGHVHIGPLNLMFDDEEAAILDIYLDIGVGGYASLLGGGLGKEFSFGNIQFEGPWYVESGKGLGLSALGIGIEYKKALSFRSDSSVIMEYNFTALVVGVGDGLILDTRSIVVRPSEQMSEALAAGGEDVWLALFDHLYSAGFAPNGYDYTGSVGRHDSFDYNGLVPIYPVTTSILRR